MEQKDIERINELYHKKKAGTITEAELAEQEKLRRDYIAAIRGNLRQTLDHTKVQYPDGKVVDLGEKYGSKNDRKH